MEDPSFGPYRRKRQEYEGLWRAGNRLGERLKPLNPWAHRTARGYRSHNPVVRRIQAGKFRQFQRLRFRLVKILNKYSRARQHLHSFDLLDDIYDRKFDKLHAQLRRYDAQYD